MDKRDGLKTLDEVMQPDIRHSFFRRVNRETGEGKALTLEDHYQSIEHYGLHDAVPDEVATQYDVARNIYIYAWYEYRFFNVSEMQALTVLEFALRYRIGEVEFAAYIKARRKKAKEEGQGIRIGDGLKALVEYCRDHTLISNRCFAAWHRQPELKAQDEHTFAKLEEMRQLGLSEIELDYSALEVPEPDDSYDHIQHLINHVNKIRNMYAHGSSMLNNGALITFEMVSEFINQLYVN